MMILTFYCSLSNGEISETDNLTVPKNLSNQNILITGAAGRTGSAIAKHALFWSQSCLFINAESLDKLLSLASLT